jgi:hypothetical protein
MHKMHKQLRGGNRKRINGNGRKEKKKENKKTQAQKIVKKNAA